jgi:hypothetical protein
METWSHGDGDMEMETWRHRHGDMETWTIGDMGTLRHGEMETWTHGDIKMETSNGERKREAQSFFLIRLLVAHHANGFRRLCVC